MDQTNAAKTALENPELTYEDKDSNLEALIHDIRSPLSGIQSISAILLRKKRLSRRELEMISVINSTSMHILKMLDSQPKSTAGAEEEDLKKKKTDVRRLVEESLLLLQFKASEKSQKITIENKKKILAYLDAEKIQRVLTNLVSNAIKFSGNETLITVSVKQQKKNLLISVEDQGIGIPEHLKNKLFDSHTDTQRPGTNNEPAHGLGLFISKQIIEAHGGKIWFESKATNGTLFFIELPILAL